MFVSESTVVLNKQYDWIGYERTFKSILTKLKQKTVESFKVNKKVFAKKRIPAIIINLLGVAVIVLLVVLASKGLKLEK